MSCAETKTIRRDWEISVIILLGPDGTGKTTLAKALGMRYYHFNQHSVYGDFLEPLVDGSAFDSVWDRHAICEFPYAQVMNRRFRFTTKEWHNLILLTLIQKPLIILCTHKPPPQEYPDNQYMPYDKWDECLELYRTFLGSHHIDYLEYDYTSAVTSQSLKILHDAHKHDMDWWSPMWHAGYGCIGSTHPRVLLVAERIGPNNANNLPFETGPTGKMLSDTLVNTGTPLGRFAVTNLVKAPRRDSRPPSLQDLDLFRVEVDHLRPERIMFMGTPARYGIRVAKEFQIPYCAVFHYGYYNYKRVTDMSEFDTFWKEFMEIV